MSDNPRLISAHICMECGAIYDRPTVCEFNGAGCKTVPVDEAIVRLEKLLREAAGK